MTLHSIINIVLGISIFYLCFLYITLDRSTFVLFIFILVLCFIFIILNTKVEIYHLKKKVFSNDITIHHQYYPWDFRHGLLLYMYKTRKKYI